MFFERLTSVVMITVSFRFTIFLVNPKWTEFWIRTTNFILFKSVFKQNREEKTFVSYVNLGLWWPKPRCNSSLDSLWIFCSTTNQLNCKCYVPWVLLWFIFKCKRIFSKLLHNCLVTFWRLIVCNFIVYTFFTLTYNTTCTLHLIENQLENIIKIAFQKYIFVKYIFFV